MKRKIILSLILLLFVSVMNAQEKQNLKVLYVGGNNSDWEESTPEKIQERHNAFVSYLNDYFAEVSYLKSNEYKPELSAGYDVTILDGTLPQVQPAIWRKHPSGEEKYFNRRSPLTEDYNYPTILIGESAERNTRAIGCKIDWYCLCLDANAYGMDLEHQIFKGPFKTEITLTSQPVPEGAKQYEALYRTGNLPDMLQMWKVQTKGYMTDKGFKVGLVSRPAGFLDSPEAEIISGGVSQKSADAIAIGRHANFFFWGFSASPAYMTDEAKDVFANAVVYTSTLKGERIIARRYYDRAATKKYAHEKMALVSEEGYKAVVEDGKKSFERNAQIKRDALAKKEKGETLNRIEEAYLKMNLPDSYTPPTKAEYIKNQARMKGMDFGESFKSYHKYMEENYPYFYGAEMFYNLIIDEDVKSLKCANSDKKLLDKAISLLEKGKSAEDIAKAQRILDRYTLCTFEKPAEWRNWYETYKDKLFFTEAGGFVFLVNDKDPEVPGNNYKEKKLYLAFRDMEIGATSHAEPVKVAAKHITIDGGRQYLIVKMKIEEGYHVYATAGSEHPFIPCKVDLELPAGYKIESEMEIPASDFYANDGTTIYKGEVKFVLPIIGDDKEGIKVNIEYQCCDVNICMAPVKSVIEVPSVKIK